MKISPASNILLELEIDELVGRKYAEEVDEDANRGEKAIKEGGTSRGNGRVVMFFDQHKKDQSHRKPHLDRVERRTQRLTPRQGTYFA